MKELSLSSADLSELLDSLLKNHCLQGIKVLCKGYSMSPFIRSEDTVVIKPIRDSAILKVGDIVAVPRNGKKHFIIHRIIKLTEDSLLLKGDNLYQSDGWFKKKEILGIIDEKINKAGNSHRLRPTVNYLIALGSRTGFLQASLSFMRKVKNKK